MEEKILSINIDNIYKNLIISTFEGSVFAGRINDEGIDIFVNDEHS